MRCSALRNWVIYVQLLRFKLLSCHCCYYYYYYCVCVCVCVKNDKKIYLLMLQPKSGSTPSHNASFSDASRETRGTLPGHKILLPQLTAYVYVVRRFQFSQALQFHNKFLVLPNTFHHRICMSSRAQQTLQRTLITCFSPQNDKHV